jgi:hypothetical protein
LDIIQKAEIEMARATPVYGLSYKYHLNLIFLNRDLQLNDTTHPERLPERKPDPRTQPAMQNWGIHGTVTLTQGHNIPCKIGGFTTQLR